MVVVLCVCVCYCAKDMYCVDLLKMFPSGHMALFACHDDWLLHSFLKKTTTIVLDTIRNGIVYKPTARNDDWSNFL